MVGAVVGEFVGEYVGVVVGEFVGEYVGVDVGEYVGVVVGEFVDAPGWHMPHLMGQNSLRSLFCHDNSHLVAVLRPTHLHLFTFPYRRSASSKHSPVGPIVGATGAIVGTDVGAFVGGLVGGYVGVPGEISSTQNDRLSSVLNSAPSKIFVNVPPPASSPRKPRKNPPCDFFKPSP
jgi:hypothetical protein